MNAKNHASRGSAAPDSGGAGVASALVVALACVGSLATLGCRSAPAIDEASAAPAPVRLGATLVGSPRLGPISEGRKVIEIDLLVPQEIEQGADHFVQVRFVPSVGERGISLVPHQVPLRSGRVALVATSDAAATTEEVVGLLEFSIDQSPEASPRLLEPPPIQVAFAGLEVLEIDETAIRPSDGALFMRNRPVTFVAPEIEGAMVVWDFGDGNTGVGTSTSHAYPLLGPRTVVLRISRPGAVPVVFTRQIEIAEIGVEIAPLPLLVKVGDLVEFRASVRGPVREVRWYIDGRLIEAGGDPSPLVSLAEAGELQVRVVALSEIGEVEQVRVLRVAEIGPEPEPPLMLTDLGTRGEVIDVGDGIAMHLARIDAGSILPDRDRGGIGSDGVGPTVVRVGEPFWIGRTEVTRAQWRAVMGDLTDVDDSMPHHPVAAVSWSDAQEFCRLLSEATGWRFRLPTESEWEYACRAGSTATYWFGDDPSRFERYVWCARNSGGSAQRVAVKESNSWGLYDPLGNVWEWCEGRFEVDQDAAGNTGEAGSSRRDSSRVLRGGGWNSSVSQCRVASRMQGGRSASSVVGFRVVREAQR